jgi:hypothetical protein
LHTHVATLDQQSPERRAAVPRVIAVWAASGYPRATGWTPHPRRRVGQTQGGGAVAGLAAQKPSDVVIELVRDADRPAA